MRRFLLLKRVLKGMGIEPERVKLVWASAAEGMKLTSEINTFVEEVRALGPLGWNKKLAGNGHVTKEPVMEMTA